MFQIEVKYHLISKLFNPKDNWLVHIDLDAMELGKGNQNKPEKKIVVDEYFPLLNSLGVNFKPHPSYGRSDIIAIKDWQHNIIEVEGDSSIQPEQALYSMLGQLILQMKNDNICLCYGIAVPYNSIWEKQILKIPSYIKVLLRLTCYLVNKHNVIIL